MTPSLPGGYRLRAFDAVGSTMDEARALAEAGEREVVAVWAREQTAGRGRRGRSWGSPPGNLYVTLLLRPPGGALEAAQLSFVSALALAEAVEPWLGNRTLSLKWPNDVLIDGAKVSGILLESQAGGSGLAWLLIGIGVNLAHAPDGLPYRAGTVAGDAPPPEPAAVLERLLRSFATWRAVLDDKGFEPIRAAWLDRAAGRGGPLRARLPNRELSGIFRDLDSDGALVLETADGQRHRITAADVFFP